MALESSATAVAPSDSVDDANGPFTSLWIGATGALSYLNPAGQTVVLPAVPVGMYKLRVRRVNVTNTTIASPGTNIVGFK